MEKTFVIKDPVRSRGVLLCQHAAHLGLNNLKEQDRGCTAVVLTPMNIIEASSKFKSDCIYG